MRRWALLVGCILLGAAPARALLPVCRGEATNALTASSLSVYTASDVGSGLVLWGTAEPRAVAVRITLNGRPLLESPLPAAGSQQAWSVAVDASDIESLPDGKLTFAAQVVRADASVADAGQLVVTKNVTPPDTTEPASVAYSDNFDACTSPGSSWTTQGNWYCAGSRLRGETGGGTALVTTAPLRDTHLSARVALTGSDTGSGLVARHANGAGYLARLVPGRGLELVRLGATTTVLAFQPQAVAKDSTHKLEFHVEGSGPVTLSARVNNGAVLQVVDSSSPLLAGLAGLYSGTAWRTQFDDFQLTGATSSGGSTPPPDPTPQGSFADDFTSCTSDNDLGGGWETTGRWYCKSVRARGETAGGLALASASLPADLLVSTRLVHTGQGGSGVVARWTTSSGYLLRLQGNGTLELVRRVGNTEQLIAHALVPLPGDTFHRLALRVTGHAPVKLEAFYEGVSVLTHDDFAADAPAQAGRVGLLSGSRDRTQFDSLNAHP